MTTLALTLPLARSSPLHIPRRDLVVDSADDLTLQLAVVASDISGAAATSLAAANTKVTLTVWGRRGWWDYGLPEPSARHALATVAGSIAAGTGGRADLVLARDTGGDWPSRVGYSITLDLGGTTRSTLAWGALHMPREGRS